MKDSSTELGELSVVAQKPLIKVEIDKLSYSVQDDPEATTSNVLELLRKVPLVTVDGNDNIQLKGGANFKIYMNGKPSTILKNNPSQVLKSMQADNIKKIEVITDPGAKYDAEGVGGIINIITAKRLDDGYSGSVGLNADHFKSYGTNASLTMKYGKVGFTGRGSYNERNSPQSKSNVLRKDFAPNSENEYEQEGTAESKGTSNYFNSTISYEPDTLNLFELSGSYFGGRWKSASNNLTKSKGLHNYSYTMNSKNSNQYGDADLSADYQHMFKKKDELLTLSYRLGHNPNSNNSETAISNVIGTSPYSEAYQQAGINKAYGMEHTAQIDYTNPLTKNHSIETGLKYIFRDNLSLGEWSFWDPNLLQWFKDPKRKNDLDHKQQILSAYAGYAYKNGNKGVKLGLRAEHTHQQASFMTLKDTTIRNKYFDLVPSATFSYQISPTQTIRTGYNMRIYRPGIWYLNPYRDDENPLMLVYGNPELEAEKNHNFNINYGSFSQKINFNITLSYSLTSNAISSYQFIKDNITHLTYDNIGIRQSTGINSYANWSPVKNFRIYVNANLSYIDLRSKKTALKNHGFSGQVYPGLNYTFLKDWQMGMTAGFFSPQIELQTQNSVFYFSNISLKKSFFDKKLDVGINLQSPFWRYQKDSYSVNGVGFKQESHSIRETRRIGLRVSYRFGNLKTSIKKVQRGISNDDLKAGEGSQGGGGN